MPECLALASELPVGTCLVRNKQDASTMHDFGSAFISRMILAQADRAGTWRTPPASLSSSWILLESRGWMTDLVSMLGYAPSTDMLELHLIGRSYLAVIRCVTWDVLSCCRRLTDDSSCLLPGDGDVIVAEVVHCEAQLNLAGFQDAALILRTAFMAGHRTWTARATRSVRVQQERGWERRFVISHLLCSCRRK